MSLDSGLISPESATGAGFELRIWRHYPIET
jgi:hypothetical protein